MEKQKIQKIVQEFLKKLQIEAKVELDAQTEPIGIKITGDNLGILVGFHGETLFTFQHLLGLIIAKAAGERKPLLVEIGDWRARRAEQLAVIAENSAQIARQTNQAQVLPPLRAQERRIIHLALANYSDIVAESEGEGENRRVVVKLASTSHEKA